MWNASRFCVSSLRRGHANLLCIVPILVYVLPKQVHIVGEILMYLSSWILPKRKYEQKGHGLTLLEGLVTTDHSLARSHYWSTRKLLAAGLPLWPGAPLLRQPDPLGFPRGGHVDANLSADASSTCIRRYKDSPPQIIPNPDLPDAGSQEFATLPVIHMSQDFVMDSIYWALKKKS